MSCFPSDVFIRILFTCLGLRPLISMAGLCHCLANIERANALVPPTPFSAEGRRDSEAGDVLPSFFLFLLLDAVDF